VHSVLPNATQRARAREELEVLDRLAAARREIDAVLTGEWYGSPELLRALARLVGTAADHARVSELLPQAPHR